jgi:hypothetical protein
MIQADYALEPQELTELIADCDRFGFVKERPLKGLKKDIAERHPLGQITAVCFKQVRSEGLHVLYLNPHGLHYVYQNL